MFTKKPEPGDSVTKMGERLGGEMKTPFTERPATYAAKSPSPSASRGLAPLTSSRSYRGEPP